MIDDLVLLDVEETVATVTINNPAKRGALSMPVMRGLIDAFTAIGGRTDVHAVILRSEGKVFSAGHDLGEVRGADIDRQREIFATCAELMLLIQQIPQPVIARVHGLATAAGCQLVATCDLAVAADDAHFATPGVKIGLFCSTPMVALTRAVDRKTAMKMLLTGEPIDAAEARTQGLVSHVVEAGELDEATARVARQVASFSAATVAVGKRAFYEQAELGTADAYAHTVDVMTRNAVAHDAQEGIGAFFEKREPAWKHRD
ncbi:MAG: enoyl-CoA hydratase [Propionibacterium sp.]|nr:enoyl-CoA hydratase [Propionibacterium sp.]